MNILENVGNIFDIHTKNRGFNLIKDTRKKLFRLYLWMKTNNNNEKAMIHMKLSENK